MRISMVTETYPPEVNGVARTIGLFTDGLRRRGHSIQLVRPQQNGHDPAAQEPGLETLLRPGIPIPRYAQLRIGLPSRRQLERDWQARRPDLVHVVTEGPLGWSALAAARRLEIPVSSGFHTNFHAYSRHYGAAWMARPVTAYLRRFHNRAACTVVPTRETQRQLEALDFQRLQVVGRGVNTTLFHPERRSRELRASWGAGDDTLVAICVSRFAAEKNFPLVLDAYAAMRLADPDARLILVGEGPLAAELQRRNVGHVVAGRQADVDLARYYASADVFLFPSLTETFGNVTLEAMASGLGIVAYDYAAAREVLEQGRSALLAPFGDATAFIAHAVTFARYPEFVRVLGRAARGVAERLTWERVIADFEAVLTDVAA